MSTTLLAVDDSVTMRKVLEVTFASEDYRLITADSADSALKKARAERPQLVLVDVTLPDQDGYALCKAIKGENPAVGVLLLSSKQGPYDAVRGSSAGADDYIDKPFDTQQLIDKVRKLALAKSSQPAVVAAAPAMVPQPAARPASFSGGAVSAPFVTRPTAPSMLAAKSSPPPAPGASFYAVPEQQPAAPVAASATVIPEASVPGRSFTAPFGTPSTTPPPLPGSTQATPPPSPVAQAANQQLEQGLSNLDLTQAQSQAVLSLSREVIERIVWEVVPTLAETMIREEIRRLLREE